MTHMKNHSTFIDDVDPDVLISCHRVNFMLQSVLKIKIKCALNWLMWHEESNIVCSSCRQSWKRRHGSHR